MKELETVVLTRPIPELGLEPGDVGAIVHRHGPGAYEVEFVTGGGRTVAVATLQDADLRQFNAEDLLHVRSVGRG